MKDRIIKLLAEDTISIWAADTTALVQKGAQLHNTAPVCTAALGRTLTAAVMMGSALKHESHRLTLSLMGGGPAGTVMATANAKAEVKGTIGNPAVNLPVRADGKLDVGRAVGKDGFLTVIKDIGLKEPYIGKTALVSGEIAEDVAAYLLYSEQQPAAVYLGVWVDTDMSVLRAGGLFVSPLPGTEETLLQKIEEKVPAIGQFSKAIMKTGPEQAAREIFSDMEIKKIGEVEPRYICDCSRERLEQVILSLGREEIEDMIEKDGGAELTCRFCNKKYRFSGEELTALLREATT